MKISDRLKTLELEAISDVTEACNNAKRLEDSGEYAQAAQLMSKWWAGVGKKPADIEQLPTSKRAAVLCRIGALSGWLGSMQQIPGSQEKAKDLVSEGANLFEAIHNWDDWAEARSDLAVCYWREGAFDEARVVLHHVLESDFIFSPELKAKVLLRLVTVETSTRHFETASSLLNQIDSLIKDREDFLSLGKFYFYRAFTSRCQGEDQGKLDLLFSAVEDYRKAGSYYKKIKHERYVAMVENNVGNVYRLLKDFRNAHLHLDSALNRYSELKDKGRAALVYDNKARTFIAQRKLTDAELAALTSVNMLREGGENAALAESLTTLAIVLNRGGNTDEAVRTFNEAKEKALTVGDTESAGNAVLTQIEELQPVLTPIVFRKLYLEAEELLTNSPKTSTKNRLLSVIRTHFENGNPDALLKSEKYSHWKNFSLPQAIHDFERELVLKALNEAGGRITKASRLLGISHQVLSQLLRQRHQDLLRHSIQRRPRGSLKFKEH